eukprot:TCONS_00008009-protein
MGKEKGGFLTPKAIANRIKSKGLQKLRWYCQMCQKQCRDENGFKCHCMSEAHQRQLLLFAENPNKYLDSFSQDFYDDFVTLLKRRFGTKRVHCNIIYQEYVAERDHTHMNATQWETLTEFVKWLGREGHCTVDETPKGWFVTYIDKDPEVIARQKAAQSQERKELDDQERMAKFIEKQVERAKATTGDQEESKFTELQREDESEKVTFDFGKPGSSKSSSSKTSSSKTSSSSLEKKSISIADKSGIFKNSEKEKSSKGKSKETTKRKSALDEILEEENALKKKKLKEVKKENWLTEGIVVKIITKKLGDKYYKQKCVIKEVKNLFIAVVEVLNSGDVIKLDQMHLETVLPGPGRPLKVVNGEHRGCNAEMIGLNQGKFTASVKLTSGPQKGITVKLPYEEICKVPSGS